MGFTDFSSRKEQKDTDLQRFQGDDQPKSEQQTLPMAAARIMLWALFLGANEYEIKYSNTKEHLNADALSQGLSKASPEGNGDVRSMELPMATPISRTHQQHLSCHVLKGDGEKTTDTDKLFCVRQMNMMLTIIKTSIKRPGELMTYARCLTRS